MDIITLVKITSRAWSLSILSSLYRGVPGRQATLIAATGATRTAFLASLNHLIELGIVERNAGHGHPLRPEYCLTDTGKHAATIANAIQLKLESEIELKLAQRNWAVPVLAVALEPVRFGEIRSSLPHVTDRALSQTLKELERQNWMERRVDNVARPPTASYRAVAKGKLIAQQCMLAE